MITTIKTTLSDAEPSDISDRILATQSAPLTAKEAGRRCIAETSYKFLREVLRQNVTLDDLATRSHIRKDTLNAMLMGRRDIDLRSLSNIATALGGRVEFSVKRRRQANG